MIIGLEENTKLISYHEFKKKYPDNKEFPAKHLTKKKR